MNEGHVSIIPVFSNNENKLAAPAEVTTNVCPMHGNENTSSYRETMDQLFYQVPLTPTPNVAILIQQNDAMS